jgi:hypothetical protein
MRQNGHGAITLEDARTWIEETGLCLFLPRRQFSSSVAPSFVEAVAGQRNPAPDPKHIAVAEELLVRLELDGVAVRLNLLGQPGEHPDFVVAAWVLPYVYALRGDRDWRRNPQLTGSRQVSPLAVQTYKLLEAGDTTIPSLKHALGREVTEGAVLRAITELWQQLRIIPVISAPGQTAKWQLLRQRYQKAIAEGASTSQVTAISVLASIYLQAVIAASMEEVELFLSPLTARSKIREVLRGLVATRQVHTISLGHAQHFYVAGTLPEFATAPTMYASSSMPASSYFLHSHEHEEEVVEPVKQYPVSGSVSLSASAATPAPRKAPESHTPRTPVTRKPASTPKTSASRPHFSTSRRPAHSRDRKPAQASSGSRTVRRAGAASSTNGKRSSAHGGNGSANGPHSNGNGALRNGRTASNGSGSKKTATPTWSARNGHSGGVKAVGKSTTKARASAVARNGSASRKDVRASARPAGVGRKPVLAAGKKVGSGKRFGFTAPSRQGTKKRG